MQLNHSKGEKYKGGLSLKENDDYTYDVYVPITCGLLNSTRDANSF